MRCLQERIARIKLDGTVDKTHTHTHNTRAHARKQGNLYYKPHYFQKGKYRKEMMSGLNPRQI